jgi:hypothetical protein
MSLRDCDELPEFNVAYDLLKVEFEKPDKKKDTGGVFFEYSPKVKFSVGLYR